MTTPKAPNVTLSQYTREVVISCFVLVGLVALVALAGVSLISVVLWKLLAR